MEKSILLTGVQQADTHPRMEEANVITADRKHETTTAHNPAARVVKALQSPVRKINHLLNKRLKPICFPRLLPLFLQNKH